MEVGKLHIHILLLFAFVLALSPRAVTQVSPQHLALPFILSAMMNEQGGVYTQYQNLLSPEEELVRGHGILLQNNGLLMLYAASQSDRQLLDQQVKLLEDHFLEERLWLLHWRLDAQMQSLKSSWETYSNDPGDSLRVVEALLLAYDVWGDESYKELALKIGEGIRKHNIAPDKTLRYYASWNSENEPAGYGDKVVLAQLNFRAMTGLAWQDRSWENPLFVNLLIALAGTTDHGLFYHSYLPKEQRHEKGDGNMIQMAQTAYHLAVYAQILGDVAALTAARNFLAFVKGEYAARGKIFGRYDPDTGTPLVNWENIAVYALIAQVALELEDVSFAETLVLEKLLPYQQLDPQSPVWGAFTARFDDAYAFDTLQALLALIERGELAGDVERESIHAVWYLGWAKESYLQRSVIDDLRQIQARLCPNYIGLFASTYQDSKTSSDPHRDPERTATDQALRHVISQIHRMGMGVILLTPLFPDDGTWEGAIRPKDIATWFDHWRKILLHYAELAEETQAEILLLGSELATLRNQTEEWDRLIVAVRSRFHGKISYSVNFWPDRDAYEQVLEMAQWEHLDYIGVTAYFELTDKTDPSIKELEAAWHNDRNGQDVVVDLEALSSTYEKPIVFWEIGYFSKDGTNIYPWDYREYPHREYPHPGDEDEKEQADCWTAFLNVFADAEWFQGYGIYSQNVGLPKTSKMYDVLHKLAEEVLREYCGK